MKINETKANPTSTIEAITKDENGGERGTLEVPR